LIELSTAYKNDENVEVVAIRNEIDALQTKIQKMDREKLDLATRRGREAASIETLVSDKKKRQTVLQKMRIHELVAVAFSKKGIPNYILSQRLPLINAELSKILAGIVDFTVELERDEDSDQLEIFLNYGDSRRIIDLGSGMEKAISSIALRVALRNVSSLPKSDFFIIDEGFGVFDEAGVEACNRLLISLKRYFRLIMVITHIDAVKDIADFTLEITKNEKESKVNFQ
jgi:exonuclease SbcC